MLTAKTLICKMISFHRPSILDEQDILKAHAELAKEEFDFCFDLFTSENFQSYLLRNQEIEAGVNLGHMVKSSFFLVKNIQDHLVGRVSIRHYLNSHLLDFGGHIGYAVLPNYRRQGHATKILEMALVFLKDQTSELKALVTCDSRNIASQKTILKNSGVLENQIQHQSRLTNRYWIDL